jgi:apolipoprotein N-acyltransferase
VASIHRSAWVLVLLSAALQILIFPLPGLYWLSWLAFAPLIVALLRTRTPPTLQLKTSPHLLPARPWQGFLLGYVSGILWFAGTCYWVFETMHQYGGLSHLVAFVVLLAFCCYVGLYHGLFGLLIALTVGRSSSLRALAAAPFLWVAVELARTRITGFPWNLLGTVQVDNVPLTRVATIAGVYGLSFEIMLVNTALAAAFLVRKEKRKFLLIASLGAAVVLQAGRWLSLPPAATDHNALLVQQNIPISHGTAWTREYFEGTLRDLSWISTKPPEASDDQKFGLIVWPESPAPFFSNDPFFLRALAGVAQQTHAWMISGAIGIDSEHSTSGQEPRAYNSALLVTPEGQVGARYDKVHLVPFGEYVPFRGMLPFMDMLTKEVGDFERGRSRMPFQAGDEKIGTFICYESIFPDEVRQFANHGAQVLVNTSNDGWYGDSGAYAQHLQQTRMRAVENSRWLLSATNTGVTASIDPFGRITARAERKMRTVLLASYALSVETTFYTRHGDWFAFLCVIISLVAILIAQFSRPKASTTNVGRTGTGI